jgi:hypothetical protein
MEIISGFVLAPAGAEVVVTNCTGDSNIIKRAPEGSKIAMLTAWSWMQAVGYLHVRSPRMHDNIVGLRAQYLVPVLDPIIPVSQAQNLISQDNLNISILSAAAAGVYESESCLIYYDDLPGTDQNLVTWDDIKARIKNILMCPITITPGVLSNYSGALPINNAFDPFKANTDYALLGYLNNNPQCSICWTGPDTGNLRVAGPGHPGDFNMTANWFLNLSKNTGLATIPVINSGNKFGTFCDVLGNNASVATIINQIYAEL